MSHLAHFSQASFDLYYDKYLCWRWALGRVWVIQKWSRRIVFCACHWGGRGRAWLTARGPRWRMLLMTWNLCIFAVIYFFVAIRGWWPLFVNSRSDPLTVITPWSLVGQPDSILTLEAILLQGQNKFFPVFCKIWVWTGLDTFRWSLTCSG